MRTIYKIRPYKNTKYLPRKISEFTSKMFKTILKSLLPAFNSISEKYGWHLKPEPDAFYIQQRLLVETSSKIIFDVGANIGQTAIKYRNLFPDAKVYSFEPCPEVFDVLSKKFANDPFVFPINTAVSSTEKFVDFYVNDYDQMSSTLPLDITAQEWVKSERNIIHKAIQVPSDQIDRFCEREKIHQVDILKMDIQGGEIDALKSAKKMLSNQSIKLIYLEINFAPLYQGQGSFCEINHLLLNHGYEFYGFYNNRHRNGKLKFCDAIFISPAILNNN